MPPRNTAIAAGTKVNDSSIAPVSASTTVIAIGWNIFPSMPSRAKIGTYTAVMMPRLLCSGLRFSEAAISGFTLGMIFTLKSVAFKGSPFISSSLPTVRNTYSFRSMPLTFFSSISLMISAM